MANPEGRRRQLLLPHNPYFKEAVRDCRRLLGVPDDGLPTSQDAKEVQELIRERHARKVGEKYGVSFLKNHWPPLIDNWRFFVVTPHKKIPWEERERQKTIEAEAGMNELRVLASTLLRAFDLRGDLIVYMERYILHPVPELGALAEYVPPYVDCWELDNLATERRQGEALELQVTVDRYTTKREWELLWKEVEGYIKACRGNAKQGRRPSDNLVRYLHIWNSVTNDHCSHDEALDRYQKDFPDDDKAALGPDAVPYAVAQIEKLMAPISPELTLLLKEKRPAEK